MINSQIKERPILFSGPMVNAIREGRKTQTRRIVKPQREEYDNLGDGESLYDFQTGKSITCPYGKPGDQLWVREAWRTGKKLDEHSGSKIEELANAAGYVGDRPKCSLKYEADGHHREWCADDITEFGDWGRYRHARFMPRWASRITLEITDVRVERLNDISEEDAMAEGCEPVLWDCNDNHTTDYIYGFSELWESINGKGSWDKNPWVWVVAFKRIGIEQK